MNTLLPPKYSHSFGNSFLLWFEPSNTYVVLDLNNMSLLRLFLSSHGNEYNFIKMVKTLDLYSIPEIKLFYKEISALLEQGNKSVENKTVSKKKYKQPLDIITVDYQYENLNFRVNYSSENIKTLIHPQIAHLTTHSATKNGVTYDVILENDMLYLYHDYEICGAFNKKDYHLLQGKFAMELICLLTTTAEHDWLGTFHASTVSNGKEAIMLIGNSGNGKSTLTTLLIANGFHLVADDLTPMLAKTQHVYNYPVAVSIKQGAFDVLRPLIKDFDSYPSVVLNKSKGNIKYIPFLPDSKNPNHYECKKIVYVKYSKDHDTQLAKIPLEDILPVLITDSWISPDATNALNFIDWLETVQCYNLKYNNTEKVIEVFNQLFES